MSKRDELIALYARELKEKCGVTPDMELLKRITIGLGPSIYREDASTVAASSPSELDTVRERFLVGKLGLTDGPDLKAGIDAVIAQYGRSNRNKYRAVVYYLLTRHFERETVYA